MPDNTLDFQCPHCNAPHRLPVQFSGNRLPCSECGKPMRLPSFVASQAPAPISSAANQTHAGAIMVECPLCNNTLYASRDKAGKEICETCLESVAVPAIADAPSNPPKLRPRLRLPSTVRPYEPAETAGKEFELSDPTLTLRPNQPESPETGQPKNRSLCRPVPKWRTHYRTLEGFTNWHQRAIDADRGTSVSPVGNQPSEEGRRDCRTEAIGDAPPFRYNLSLQFRQYQWRRITSTAPEYELVIRGILPALPASSRCRLPTGHWTDRAMWQMQSAHYGHSPPTAPATERVIKQPHRFAGEQTRIAQLSE